MNDQYIIKVLESCVHEVQIFAWLGWIERLDIPKKNYYIYTSMGQIKLDELYQELENGRDNKTKEADRAA